MDKLYNFFYFYQVVTISELGSETDPNNANIAIVKFTVRTAGQYKISVLIGSSHISGSPFLRTFMPGQMDARRSRLIRPASTVVCCAGSPTLLYIEPRDEYGNACTFSVDDDPTKGYSIQILDLNDVAIDKLASALILSYDKVNSRVTITTLFPEPVCVKASISYVGQKLSNGDFDIIVLSSKQIIKFGIIYLILSNNNNNNNNLSKYIGSDTTLVHKNIASRKHNICYEAKLLSVFGQPKSKARKVLCYVGPKQVITSILI